MKSNSRNGSRVKPNFSKATLGALTLFGMLIAAMTVLPLTAHAATKIDTTQFQLEIFPIAPELPADEGTYYAMISLETLKDSKPIPAPYDLDITVISSDPSVIVSQDKVTLKEGDSMVKAELKTTKKASEVSISAQTEGIKSDSVTINTVRLDSQEPTKLILYSAPPSFVPDPAFPGLMYVQLLNSQNLPAAAANSITVTLASSKPEIGNVPNYVTIQGGQTGAVFNFSPKSEVGTAKISASSPGLSPAQLDVKTDVPAATQLVVEFGPPTIPAFSGFNTLMTVQLRDSSDTPVKAPAAVNVILKSSDTTIADVPTSVTIQEGKTYAEVMVKSKGGSGSTVITASSTGIASGISSISTTGISTESGTDDMTINLYTVPTKIPPDNSEHASIIMQFSDSSGAPWNAPASAYNRVIVSSSDSKIGTVQQGYITQNGYAQMKFKTTFVTGVTTLTASSTGFIPSQIELEVAGSSPKALKVDQIPKIIQAANNDVQSLVVSFVDASGKPVITPQDTTVFLSSSVPSIATVQASVIMPAGTSYSIVNVQNTDKPGMTTITATASDLASDDIEYNTVGYVGSISQYALGLYAVPKISSDGQSHEAVFVQLQDQTGTPVPAASDIVVTLTSSAIDAGNIQGEATIPKGSVFAIAKFTSSSSITTETKFKITASSPGFKSVDADMQVVFQPLTIKITNTLPRNLNFGDTISIAYEVKSGSIPIKDATIELGGKQSNPSYSTTNEEGIGQGDYSSRLPGTNAIEVKATKPGFKEAIAKANVLYAQTINLTLKAVSEGGTPLSASLTVQGPTGTAKEYKFTPEAPAKLTKAKWGTYRITAPQEFSNSMGKFTFSHWSDGSTTNQKSFDVISDSEIKAVYSAKFLVTVSSDYGQTSGSGYYSEGTMVGISIDTTTVSGFIPKNFAGWTGDFSSQAPAAQVKVNGPKVIKAAWQDSYLMIGLIAGAIGGGGAIAYFKVLKPKKEAAAKSKAPDLDWYKS